MRTWVLLIIFLSNALIGCASSDKGKNVLAERSVLRGQFQSLDLGVGSKAKIGKTKSSVVHAWRHETELPSGDYFWGGWLSLVVTKPQWAKSPKQ